MGDCIKNGDSGMKGLDKNCGCPPEPMGTINVHKCCRPHLVKLLRDVYGAMIDADLPFIMQG